jgi:glycosyltransferase involved in cell wall biosynthesis
MMSSVMFWGALLFVWYAYMGYPLALRLLSMFWDRPVKKEAITPRVTFIITAFNEEARIQEKLENTLQLDYPKDLLAVIVASDCSTDRTDAIVSAYASRGVQLARAPERKGKEHAQKHALQFATGEIVVFSDVATILNPDAVRTIVENFADSSVGCVSSVDRFIDPDGSISGEGAYVRYEMFLRGLESRVNTLVGLSGSFFAARREVCADWATHLQSDFNTVLNAVRLGLRGVSDSESVGYYKNIADGRREYERKVRTVLRGISVFMQSIPLVNPFRYGLFAWQLISHKLCRWLVPFAMMLLLASNVVLLSESRFYQVMFVAQVLFYGIASAGIVCHQVLRHTIMKIPSFFVLVNLSILTAWYRYVRGQRVILWEPSKR